MKQYIILFLLFALPVMAENEQFELDKSITLKRTCYYNNTWCNNSISCNITIINPEKETITDNQQMTRTDSYYEFNLGLINTTGTYNAFMNCIGGVLNGFDDFQFEVNKYGRLITPTTLIALLIGLGFAIAIMLFIAAQVGDDHVLLKLFLIYSSIFMTLLIPVYMIQLINIPIMNSFYKGYLWVVRIFVAYSVVYLAYQWFKGLRF